MIPKPVTQSRLPAYPTRREVLTGAATFALAQFAGTWRLWAADEAGTTIVAPIFEHGEGRGATGCVVVSPPVFLSEEEAMQIIREELAKHGIQLKDGVVFEGVRIPQRFLKHDFEKSEKKRSEDTVLEAQKRAKPLELNGVDSEKRVAVEFVSKRRYFDLGGVQESYSSGELDDPDTTVDDSGRTIRWGHYSTVQSYDFKGTAEFVAAQVKKQGKDPIYLGLFYDPQREARRMTDETNDTAKLLKEMRKMLETTQEQWRDDAKKLLRQQVQDFAAWLKEKKAVP